MKMKLLVLEVLAVLANAQDFKVVFENIGEASGISLYWTGTKEGLGSEMPDRGGLESFKNYLQVGDKTGQRTNFGSRFVIRGKDSRSGPGFRAAVQFQKGETQFPYKFVVTAIGEGEDEDPSVELVYHSHTGSDPGEKAREWIAPGQSVARVTHSKNHNHFEIWNRKNEPVVAITFADVIDKGEL